MNTKYDEEIRQVESRLVREREALKAKAEDLTETARDAAVSPKGLVAAFAIGFLLGELTAPKRRKEKSQVADTTKKVGIGGLLGSALFAFARSQYGSPWTLGRSAWEYAAALRARRAAAAASAAGAAAASRMNTAASAPPVNAAGATYGNNSGRSGPAAAYREPTRSPQGHAAG
jgi:hypothetical protein